MGDKTTTIKIEVSTAAATVIAIIAGSVLLATGQAEAGAALLAFATGAATFKPILRREEVEP